MAKCSSCGADIFWAITMTGKKIIPVDAKPEKRLVLTEAYREEIAPTAEVKDTYLSHFVSCPNAAQHRKK